MPHCYDLVGTLAQVSYPSENITSVIYKPTGSFVIVTAQGAGSHAHLYAQVRDTFPNVIRIHTVRTGTDKLEGKRKAAVLKRIGAHSYTDNNRAILNAIAEILPDLPLYLMTSRGRRRV